MIHTIISGMLPDGTPQHVRAHVEQSQISGFIDYALHNGASVSTGWRGSKDGEPCGCPEEIDSHVTGEEYITYEDSVLDALGLLCSAAITSGHFINGKTRDLK